MLSMNSFYQYFLCFFIVTASLQGYESDEAKGKTSYLHAIVVADTLDKDIGKHVNADLNNIVKETRKIACYTGMSLNLITIKGHDVNHKKILSTVRRLKIARDDAVLFYFSGHGYRTNSKNNNPWPNLFLTGSDSGIDFSFIVEMILRKSPRFILALADSCNAGDDVDKLIFKSLPKAKDNLVKENYRQLFLRSQGLVMAAGAIPGELSYTFGKVSAYTLAFLKAMDEETRYGTGDWYTVMVGAQNKVNSWKNQHPYWIYLEDIKDQRAVLNKIGR